MEETNKCPTYLTGIVNHKPAIFFDTADDMMKTTIDTDLPYTIFIVANQEEKQDKLSYLLSSPNQYL
jgi:hypothetical protein